MPNSSSLVDQHMDHADRESSGHGTHGNQDPSGHQDSRPELGRHRGIGRTVQQILGAMPEMRSIFAERVAQGFYIQRGVNRAEAARYGLTVGDVQRTITSGIGGRTSPRISRGANAIHLRPLCARFSRRHSKARAGGDRDAFQRTGPLGELAKISFSKGPAMIRDEDAALTGYVVSGSEHSGLWRLCLPS